MVRCFLILTLVLTVPIAGCASHGSAANLEAIRLEAARNQPPPGADPLGDGRRPEKGYWEEHAPLKYALIALGVTTAVVLIGAAVVYVGGRAYPDFHG